MPYRYEDIRRLSRDITGEQMSKDYGLVSGKLSPWQLPEWNPMIQGLRSSGGQQLSDLAKNLSQAKVSGPAFGTILERGGEATNNAILNLVNQLMQGRGEEGINLWMGLRNQSARRAAQEAQKTPEWQRYVSMIPLIGSTISGVAGAFRQPTSTGGSAGAGAGAGGLGLSLLSLLGL